MIKALVQEQSIFFASQQTKDIAYRKKYLKKLLQAIIAHENAICDAIYKDFKKPPFETLVQETQLVISELKYLLNHLELWSKPVKVKGSLASFPSINHMHYEPYGKVLIMSPWNYPFLLTISPLIGALAAGNTVVLKPSELSPNATRAMAVMIEEVFPKEYVSLIEGGVDVSKNLLLEKWDYIFFTGSTNVGKIVYKSAAEHLTPVTLELGGKNPCIIDETASIKLAAKRIAWGKFMNAGQTCVAPDYILIHSSVKDEFVRALQGAIEQLYGKKVQESKDFARVATEQHYNTLVGKLEGQTLLFGGNHDDSTRYIEPTIVDEPDLDSPIMQDEIFGPILPILSYTSKAEIEKIVLKYDMPLSFYVFSNRSRFSKELMKTYAFGGGTINDVVMQIANKNLPFGGIGHSGIGAYHGKHSFELFSHKKAIVKRPNWLDVPIRYAPYNMPLKWVKWFKHLF